MTLPFTTVALTAENIVDCADLYLGVFNAPPWNDGWEHAAVRERLEAFMAFPAARGMALLLEGVPVAMVLGWKERWVNGWTFHIKEMCVAGHLQRQGAGAALMGALEDGLRGEGVMSVNLQTLEEAPAFGFYEGLGYRKGRVVMLGSCCSCPSHRQTAGMAQSGNPQCRPCKSLLTMCCSQPLEGTMENVTWDHDPPTTWIATVSGQAVCSIKRKDIGGWTAGWTDERLWPPPSHLPKALPQPTRFFSSLEEAKAAVEQALAA